MFMSLRCFDTVFLETIPIFFYRLKRDFKKVLNDLNLILSSVGMLLNIIFRC